MVNNSERGAGALKQAHTSPAKRSPGRRLLCISYHDADNQANDTSTTSLSLISYASIPPPTPRHSHLPPLPRSPPPPHPCAPLTHPFSFISIPHLSSHYKLSGAAYPSSSTHRSLPRLPLLSYLLLPHMFPHLHYSSLLSSSSHPTLLFFLLSSLPFTTCPYFLPSTLP